MSDPKPEFTRVAMRIDNFHTAFALRGADWSPGQPHERHNALDVDYSLGGAEPHTVAVDRDLDRLGYERTTEWTYDASRDERVAEIRRR